MSREGFSIYGDVTLEEITDALKKKFPNKVMKFFSKLSEHALSDIHESEIYITKSYHDTSENSLAIKLDAKNKELKAAEESCHKSALSVQALHKQQQALFDEFVLLRQKYDEQKSAIVNILWNQCSLFHPDLRQIPAIENNDNFIESEEQIGSYLVHDMLGEGQFASVKSCTKINTHEEFALKIIKKDRITSFTSLTRVANEIDSLRVLKSCSNIVHIYEVIHSKTMLYIITEKGGFDLFDFFDEYHSGVPEIWAKQILACILKGVLYCHEHGICHRGLH
jgi:hypothetical protein